MVSGRQDKGHSNRSKNRQGLLFVIRRFTRHLSHLIILSSRVYDSSWPNFVSLYRWVESGRVWADFELYSWADPREDKSESAAVNYNNKVCTDFCFVRCCITLTSVTPQPA